MYFAYFQNLSIKVTPKFEKYGKCLAIFANTTSKCTCIRKLLPYVRGMKCSWGRVFILNFISVPVGHPVYAGDFRGDEIDKFNLLF